MSIEERAAAWQEEVSAEYRRRRNMFQGDVRVNGFN